MTEKKRSDRVELDLEVRLGGTPPKRDSTISGSSRSIGDRISAGLKSGASEVAGCAAKRTAEEFNQGLVQPASEEMQWLVNRLDLQIERFRCSFVAVVEESTTRIDTSVARAQQRAEEAVELAGAWADDRMDRIEQTTTGAHERFRGYWIDAGVLLFYSILFALVIRLDAAGTLWLPQSGLGLPRFLYVVFMAATIPTAIAGVVSLGSHILGQTSDTFRRVLLSFLKFGVIMIAAGVMAVVAHLLLN